MKTWRFKNYTNKDNRPHRSLTRRQIRLWEQILLWLVGRVMMFAPFDKERPDKSDNCSTLSSFWWPTTNKIAGAVYATNMFFVNASTMLTLYFLQTLNVYNKVGRKRLIKNTQSVLAMAWSAWCAAWLMNTVLALLLLTEMQWLTADTVYVALALAGQQKSFVM